MTDPSGEHIEKKFEQFLSSKSLSSKGRVYVIDLSQVKETLSENWGRLKEKVYSTAQTVIQRRTDDSDIFDRWTDESYIIAFGQLDEARARIKVNLIVQEIAIRLLGKKEAASHQIRVTMADTDGQGNVIWDHKNDPSKLISRPAPRAPGVKKAPPQPVFSRDIDFVFRPLWFLKNEIISSYCCIPIKKVSSERFSSSYGVIEDEKNHNAVKALDLLTMKKVYHEAARLEREKITALLAMPLHFESLANTNRKTDIVKHCQRYLKQFNKRIVTELVHLPEGIPQSRLQELVQSVKPFSRAVMTRFKLSHQDFASYKDIGVFAVGADIFEDKRPENKIITDIENFARLAEKANLSTYIHGIRTTSLATAAICSGIEYIDGYAVSSVEHHPKDAHLMSIRENYLAKFNELLG